MNASELYEVVRTVTVIPPPPPNPDSRYKKERQPAPHRPKRPGHRVGHAVLPILDCVLIEQTDRYTRMFFTDLATVHRVTIDSSPRPLSTQTHRFRMAVNAKLLLEIGQELKRGNVDELALGYSFIRTVEGPVGGDRTYSRAHLRWGVPDATIEDFRVTGISERLLIEYNVEEGVSVTSALARFSLIAMPATEYPSIWRSAVTDGVTMIRQECVA